MRWLAATDAGNVPEFVSPGKDAEGESTAFPSMMDDGRSWRKMTGKEDVKLKREWVRQNNLTYGALIGVGLLFVQPFLTAGTLDLSARICVVAFSVAIPLLSALVLVTWQETFRGRAINSGVVTVAKVVAQSCAFVGLTSAFWHIWWIAGVTFLACRFVGVAVHTVGYTRLEQGAEPGSKEPG